MSALLPDVVTIDGPAASGKGTVAAGVARALNFHYLDSGSLYRLTALTAMRTGVPLDDGPGLARIAQDLDIRFADGVTYLGGEDVTQQIRTEDVSAGASRVAVQAALRSALFDRQRAFARPPGLVADGRDMGTVVFPDAKLKVFLTASAQVRARRRHKQLIANGISDTMENLLRDIQARDKRDAERATAPLLAAGDAVKLDTTDLAIDTVVNHVLELYRAMENGTRP
jgi:3-phosphoshikimate 1-carboxyvinyltransferase